MKSLIPTLGVGPASNRRAAGGNWQYLFSPAIILSLNGRRIAGRDQSFKMRPSRCLQKLTGLPTILQHHLSIAGEREHYSRWIFQQTSKIAPREQAATQARAEEKFTLKGEPGG